VHGETAALRQLESKAMEAVRIRVSGVAGTEFSRSAVPKALE
jgi:hypothetical protein